MKRILNCSPKTQTLNYTTDMKAKIREKNKPLPKRFATLYLCISAALLTADDLWGIDQETTDKFVVAFGEVLNGYGDEDNIMSLKKELDDRGIRVNFGNNFITGQGERKYERGCGTWVEHKSGKGRYYTCSHCGAKTVIKRKYCSVCGAINKKEGSV